MKSNKLIFIIIILVIMVFGAIYYFLTPKPSLSQEGIVCGSTIPTRCYKYQCTTGYIDPKLIPPGGGRVDGTNLCSDGSNAVNLGEVEK